MPELLSPVGNMECLMAAINGGGDAVYLAGKRNFIQLHVNISLEYVMIIPEPDATLE